MEGFVLFVVAAAGGGGPGSNRDGAGVGLLVWLLHVIAMFYLVALVTSTL